MTHVLYIPCGIELDTLADTVIDTNLCCVFCVVQQGVLATNMSFAVLLTRNRQVGTFVGALRKLSCLLFACWLCVARL